MLVNSNRSFRKRAMSWIREENYKTNYFQKIDSTNSEMLKYKEQLEECEKEKKLLADKIIGLERKINDLQKTMEEGSVGHKPVSSGEFHY